MADPDLKFGGSEAKRITKEEGPSDLTDLLWEQLTILSQKESSNS